MNSPRLPRDRGFSYLDSKKAIAAYPVLFSLIHSAEKILTESISSEGLSITELITHPD